MIWLSMEIQWILQYSQKILRFFMASLAGLTVDLLVFQSATYCGFDPFRSNMLSSILAIITTYWLLTNHLFPTQKNMKTFFFFFAYYSFSITFFSLGIASTARLGGWPPVFCKILSLPLSFAANSFASTLLLGKK